MGLQKIYYDLYKKISRHLIKKNYIQLDTYIDPRVEIMNSQYMKIGRADIKPYSFIYAIKGDFINGEKFQPLIKINDGCTISRFCQITCSNQLIFEKNVFISERVLITDSLHSYNEIKIPIKHQELISHGPIIIGEGSWVGSGSQIIGKLKIGKNCIIGSNTILNYSVPDYSVVVGSPARLIKRYNLLKGIWEDKNILLKNVNCNK